jgi:hypothetical protein
MQESAELITETATEILSAVLLYLLYISFNGAYTT